MLDENIENKPVEGIENTTAKEDDKVSEKELDTNQEENQQKIEEAQEISSVKEETVEEKPPIKEVKKVDYTSLDLENLVEELKKVLKNNEIHLIKDDVELIKTNFNQKFGALLTEKKKAFIEDGGNEIDFQYNNPIKSTYNDLLFEYKVKRQQYYKAQETLQKDNLNKRLALIEELKHLIDNAEASTMYKNFRELQDKWRIIGKIPHSKYNDVWRTYHHHVERFYDLLHLNNDFRDLDFKHNLEEKLKLVEKAESLAEETDINKSFKELQVLHKLWKEDIGPVAREYREDIWGRFSAATKKIHNKRHEAQKGLESKYQENYEKKLVIVDQIKELIIEQSTSHSVWQKKIKDLEALRQSFFKIGRVPRAKNNEIWQAFKDATRDFNRAKNVFYKNVKKGQQDNLNKKMALVEKAESLKDSDDWETTTPIMKEIQVEWKSIGHVPRKYSDEIWKRFKDACNHYFDKLHGVQDEANKEQVEIFNKKKALLDNLKSQAEGSEALTLEVIQSYTDDWKKLGAVPFNMRHIEPKFNRVLDKLYEKLNLDKGEVAMLKFKNIIDGYIANKQFKKIDDEQYFVRKKIDESTREIKQLENNISFISSDTDDNPLIKNVQKNIDKYSKDLDVWKNKLEYIKKLEY